MQNQLTQAQALFYAGNQLMRSGENAEAEGCFR
jgi:hypothetical protein